MGRTLFLSLALSSLWAVQAGAVVIATGDGSGNTTAPNDDPGWANVGYLGSGSGVYLGNRWVLTAAHVGAGPITFPNGTFTVASGSAMRLQNPTGFTLSQFADLTLFRLETDPGLPALTMNSVAPNLGSLVTMIGAGKDRDPAEIGWERQQSGTNVTWTQTPIQHSNARGFTASGPNTMRWGFNVVSDTNRFITNGNGNDVIGFVTPFFETSTMPYQAQAASGDSGGAVFNLVGGNWQLAGIINSVSPLTGQPFDTAVFGDLTYSAQLSEYHDQITSLMHFADFPWQNPTISADVNNDGTVTALDALLIINPLNSFGPGNLPPSTFTPPPYYDPNGDNFFSALDALVVINVLNSATSAPRSFGVDVPEPSSFALASVALAGLSFLGWRRLQR